MIALLLTLHLTAAHAGSDVATSTVHPMDALSGDEIRAAIATLRKANRMDDATRVVSLSLDENPKAEVRSWKPGQAIPRRARGVLIARGDLFEAEIDVGERTVSRWTKVGGRQSAFTVDEMINAGDLPKKDPRWRAAMAKRGITDYADLACFPLAAGPVTDPALAGRRLLQVPCFDTKGAANNLWGKPVEGIIATVDLNARSVVSVMDLGVVPSPSEMPSHAYADSGQYRPIPKLVEIAEPRGSNVSINGSQVRWDNWSFHVRLDQRVGTVLSLIRYDDHGDLRDVAYEISASEMYVPYMDPAPTWSFRAYMDIGEYGFGALASQLRPGQDCPATAAYLNATVVDGKGSPVDLKGVICVFERPTGDPIWRHDELWNGTVETRPDVELVVRMAPVVGNYDYLVDYVFDRAGAIAVRLGAYGIDATKGVASGRLGDPGASADTKYGSLVADRLLAVNHDHYMAFRLDMDVDGTENRLVQDVFRPERLSDAGERRSLWRVRSEPVPDEGPIAMPMNTAQFRVESANRTNKMGYPTSYQIMPGETETSILAREDPIQKRAAFTDYTLWATAYDPDQRYASGAYPNENAEMDGLPHWVEAKRSIRDRDLVLWYTVGFRHVARSEDWPAMPGLWHSFRLRPFNFFDRNPALDVPPVDVLGEVK